MGLIKSIKLIRDGSTAVPIVDARRENDEDNPATLTLKLSI